MTFKFAKDCGSTNGITVIQLVLVMGLVGIIITLGAQGMRSYRQRAYDSRALEELRSVIAAQESFYIDEERYESDVSKLPAFKNASEQVIVRLQASYDSWKAGVSDARGKSYILLRLKELIGYPNARRRGRTLPMSSVSATAA